MVYNQSLGLNSRYPYFVMDYIANTRIDNVTVNLGGTSLCMVEAFAKNLNDLLHSPPTVCLRKAFDIPDGSFTGRCDHELCYVTYFL